MLNSGFQWASPMGDYIFHLAYSVGCWRYRQNVDLAKKGLCPVSEQLNPGLEDLVTEREPVRPASPEVPLSETAREEAEKVFEEVPTPAVPRKARSPSETSQSRGPEWKT